MEDTEAENSVVNLNNYKKKPIKKSAYLKQDRSESKENLIATMMEPLEIKIEQEGTKKSASVVIYPLEIKFKIYDEERFELSFNTETAHGSILWLKESIINDSSDETTLSILKKLSLGLEFYGFVFTSISKWF